MTRLIEADELEKKLPNDLPYKASVKRVLIQAPTVDAEPVRHGKWVEQKGYDQRDNFYKCSECGRTINVICGSKLEDYPYCHCGAKMDGE